MRHLRGFDSEQGHGYVSRPLTRTEMQFFSFTLDERQAIALAKVCHIPEDASYAVIEDAVLKCFNAALEHAGLKNSVEYIDGQRRDTLRVPVPKCPSGG
jgi:hypothetical protein